MTVKGLIGGSHAGSRLADYLRAASAARVSDDKRALKRAAIDLRGW